MKYQEGQVAVNPETGDKVVLRNNQWVTYAEEQETVADRTSDFLSGIRGDVSDAGQFLKENLDIPAGIAGAGAGFMAGAPLGPIGAIGGGIAGGAAGTFSGSLASSAIEGEADLEKAAIEAAQSVAIDVVTLGTGKVIKPVAKALGIDPLAYWNKLSGKTPDAQTVRKAPIAPASGTPESLLATQKLLEQEGGTLLASQTQNASKIRKLAETIGSVGILSKGRLANIAQQNKNSIVKEIDGMIDGINPSLANTPENLGQHIYEIIDSGRKLNMINYSSGLARLSKKFGGSQVNPAPILDTIDTFLASSVKDGLSELKPNTLEIIEKTRRDLVGQQLATQYSKGDTAVRLPKATVDKIFTFQKNLNDDISSFGSFGGNRFDSQVEAELSALSSKLRKSIDKSLSGINSELASDFRGINKAYGETLDALLPKINSSIVTRADKVDYEKVGRLLLTNNSTSKISAMMKSIDTAFAQTKKAGLPINSSIQSASQAKQSVRQSYIYNMFGDTAGDFDPYRWANKAKSFDKNPNEVVKLKAILGKDGYNSFKTLTNAIADSSEKPTADAFSLMLRGRESAATIGLPAALAAGAGYGASGAMLAGASALAVFAIPEVLGRVATNKRAVNKLLMLNSNVKKNPDMKAELIAAQVAKVLNELDESDKEAIADSINGY
tara:strand:- start:49 stop:2052 length:2004 start_codon:yes stop_codon:yes gene_type:complete